MVYDTCRLNPKGLNIGDAPAPTYKEVITSEKPEGYATVADLMAVLSGLSPTARVVFFAEYDNNTTSEQTATGQVDTYDYGKDVAIWLERCA